MIYMAKVNTRLLLRCAMSAALTAVGAFIRIPFALSAITLQFFFTAMAGFVLGAGWGAASQAVYVLLGLAGLPIFAAGGGFGYVLYPSFGFLLGLIPSAWVVGRIGAGSHDPWRIALACLAGLGVLYLVGLPYMAVIFDVYRGQPLPFWKLIRDGMLIFLPGDMLKIAVCMLLAPQLTKRLSANIA